MHRCLLLTLAVVFLGSCRSIHEPDVKLLSSTAPDARWDAESIRADFDCDGQLDVARLGHRAGEVIVGVVPVTGREPQLLTFAVGARQHQVICAEPARLALESLVDGPPDDIGPIGCPFYT